MQPTYLKNFFSIAILPMATAVFLFGACLTQASKPDSAKFVLTSEMKTIASQYKQELEKRKPTLTTTLAGLKRKMDAKTLFDQKNWSNAISDFEMILSEDPEDFQAWVFLLLAYLRNTEAYKWYSAERPVGAALNAYGRAKKPLDQAAILWLLSQLDKKYGDARSVALQLAKQEEIDRHLVSLTATYPEAFLPYDIEIPQRAATGSVCVSLTRPLLKKRTFNYKDYIDVSPSVADLAVIAKGNRICLEGLAFGKDYKLTLKKGLPGENNQALAEAQTLNVLVPHRIPQIAFRERGYILPRHGSQVLPLMGVNVPNTYLEIFHIPNENLSTIITKYTVGQSIGPWMVEEIGNNNGETLWKGTFDLNGKLDVSTFKGIPIDKLLGKQLGAGLYVLFAHLDAKPTYAPDRYTTQWFMVTDIGLSTYRGPDGLHVFAYSLNTAQPLKDVAVEVITFNNRHLAIARTDKNGYIHIPHSLLQGEGGNRPHFIKAAHKGQDMTFLLLTESPFDLSDRGVEGRLAPGPIDAYVYTERGIYRPGEKVQVVALLRDAHGKAIEKVPAIFRLIRPDGIELAQTATADKGSGGHQYEWILSPSSPTGTWSVAVFTEPKGREIGRATFVVNDFVPPRIEVKASSERQSIKSGDAYALDMTARYFFGPPAEGLKVQANASLEIAEKPFAKWETYTFGLEEETWAPLRFNFESTQTDAKGHAHLTTVINAQPATSHILALKSTATVYEPGGRGRSVTQQALFWHQPYAIGISPFFTNRSAPENSVARFNIMAVGSDGSLRRVENLKYSLFEESHDFVWYNKGGEWHYEVVVRDRPLVTGTLALNDKAPTLLEEKVIFGRYRLEILDEQTGVASSYRFSAGWQNTSDQPDRPDMVEVKLDKESYGPNDKATVFIKAPFEGQLVLAYAGQNFTVVHRGKIGREQEKIVLPLKQTLAERPGGYLVATVFRPANPAESKMPGRGIGVSWLSVKDQADHLQLVVKAPEEAKPNTTLDVTVEAPKGEKQAYVTIAAVDESLLQLTDFKTPDPYAALFAQRKLAYDIRDGYGHLINPYGAPIGDYHVGGDAGLSNRHLAMLAVRSFKTMTLFSGILTFDGKGHARIPVQLSDFSGRLRIMAVAWNKQAVGNAEAAVKIHDDVEGDLGLPRFMAPNDEATITLSLLNLTGDKKQYKVGLAAKGSVSLAQPLAINPSLAPEKTFFAPATIKATSAGVGHLTVNVDDESSFHLVKTWDLPVRYGLPRRLERQYLVLKPGETLTLDPSQFKNFISGTAVLEVSAGHVPDFGARALLNDLLTYPYGCAEQLTSRGFGYLFAEPLEATLKKDRIKDDLAAIVNQLFNLQRFDGSFGLWTAGSSAEPWVSLYTLDFLGQVRAQGYPVSEAIITRGTEWLSELLQGEANTDEIIALQAYGHYLVARDGRGNLGLLRYFSDNNAPRITSAKDRAFIAAAFALYGEAGSASHWFKMALEGKEPYANDYFGSTLRDKALILALMAETLEPQEAIMDLAAQVAELSNGATVLSTQEKAWLVRAAAALKKLYQKPIHLHVGTEKVEGVEHFERQWIDTARGASMGENAAQEQNILTQPLTLKNSGEQTLALTLVRAGIVHDLKALASKGAEISRELYTVKGDKIQDLTNVKSGDLMLVVLRGTLTEGDNHYAVILDLLPAGFEIENARLTEAHMLNNFSWLGAITESTRVEGRDDRFVAFLSVKKGGNFTVPYLVRAVTPGRYTYPAPYVESMYRPQFFAFGSAGMLSIKAP